MSEAPQANFEYAYIGHQCPQIYEYLIEVEGANIHTIMKYDQLDPKDLN